MSTQNSLPFLFPPSSSSQGDKELSSKTFSQEDISDSETNTSDLSDVVDNNLEGPDKNLNPSSSSVVEDVDVLVVHSVDGPFMSPTPTISTSDKLSNDEESKQSLAKNECLSVQSLTTTWPYAHSASHLLGVFANPRDHSDGYEGHTVLVDASGFLHRAWHKARPVMTPEGEMGMMRLFCKMTAKILDRMANGKHPPTHLAWVWDPPREDSWRRLQCPSYKANREDKPASFMDQLPWVEKAARTAGFYNIKDGELEADDVIASLALHQHAEAHRVTILSSDKDLFQLVRPGIVQMDAARNTFWTTKTVEERFEVSPVMLRDWLTLAGDSADGIPGAKGIGKKTASALLKEHGSLDVILDRAADLKPAGVSKKIMNATEALREARLLVSLRLDDEKARDWSQHLTAPNLSEAIEHLSSWGQMGPIPEA